jgi:hypothetical protein
MAFCDGCGKERKPYRYARDGEYPTGLMFCFLCVKEDERAEAKRCPCGAPVRCKAPSRCAKGFEAMGG